MGTRRCCWPCCLSAPPEPDPVLQQQLESVTHRESCSSCWAWLQQPDAEVLAPPLALPSKSVSIWESFLKADSSLPDPTFPHSILHCQHLFFQWLCPAALPFSLQTLWRGWTLTNSKQILSHSRWPELCLCCQLGFQPSSEYLKQCVIADFLGSDFKAGKKQRNICASPSDSLGIVRHQALILCVCKPGVHEINVLFVGFVHNLFWACCSSIIVHSFTHTKKWNA